MEEYFLIIVLGLVNFLDALFERLKLWEWLAHKGAYSGNGFFSELSQCRFCVLFHIGWIITLSLGLIFGFNYSLIIIPFISSGITHLLKKNGL